jgi:hypothetical protein
VHILIADLLKKGGLLRLDRSNTTSEQEEESSPITSSMKLGILAAAITTLGDALALIATLEAVDEVIAADIQDKKDKKELDEKLQNMQDQIDKLTDELSKISDKSE